MTVIRRDGVMWAAPRDGLAHATPPGAIRALCGIKPLDPRYAWPVREFCAVCTALAKGQRKGAA